MKTNSKGLYVHIPLCAKKCNYCDFCSFSGVDENTKASYINRLCEEIASYKNDKIEFDTVFFGGGTPTLLEPCDLSKIMSAIRKSFVLSESAEITMEANPGTANFEKLKGFVECGINRFSVGLQTIHENELKKLGRIHTHNEFLTMYSNLRKLGIKNINVDLMYGIPMQTMESFSKTLHSVAELTPEHISVYGLILEEGTPFYNEKSTLALPPEDDECDMYNLACEILASTGYKHYEISNYAKPGYESRHNLKYWHSAEYIGVGLSAYSYYKGKRFGNTKVLCDYINSKNIITQSDLGDKNTEKYEYVMLALRLKEGFSLSEYKKLFGEDFLVGREELLARFESAGYLKLDNDRLCLTEKGFYVSNSIIVELL